MATGIVNDHGEQDDAAFRRVIAARPEAVQEIALAARRLVYDVLPQTVEVVWERQGSVGWGTGPKKMSEHFAYLLPYQRHVTLGFYYGGGLDDPAGLLRDGNTTARLDMRSMKLTSLADVARPELRALVDAATRHVVPPPAER